MLSNVVIKEMPVAPKMTSEVYSNKFAAIFKSSIRLIGEYAFSSYSFIIPKGKMPPFIIDNQKIEMNPGQVFPVNPGQQLKSTFQQNVESFFAVHIDSEFMQQIAKNTKGHSRIFFKNENIISAKSVDRMIQKFIYESTHKETGYQFMLQSISTELTVEMLRQSILCGSIQSRPSYNLDIQKAIAFLEERYQEHITLSDMAKEVNISQYHLARRFKSETGKTPFDFLTDIRIQYAKGYLLNSSFNMTEICSLSGFSNASHFSIVFKKKTGLTPSEFRNHA